MSRQARFGWLITGALMCGIFAALGICGYAAAAQEAASQPASFPAVGAASGGLDALFAWLCANWVTLTAIAIALLSALATGLSDYPRAKGCVKWLRLVVSVLSVVQYRNAPNSLKWPLTRPSVPVQPASTIKE